MINNTLPIAVYADLQKSYSGPDSTGIPDSISHSKKWMNALFIR